VVLSTLPVLDEIVLRLLLGLLFGALIGLERSYHGRPAGFRTHALVCMASTALMLVTVYEQQWFQPPEGTRATIDPTRVATLTDRITVTKDVMARLAPLVGMMLRTRQEPVTA